MDDGKSGSRRWEWLAFLGLAVLVAIPRLHALDALSTQQILTLYADSQIADLVYGFTGPRADWWRHILHFDEGPSVVGGSSLMWNLVMWPFVQLVGLSVRALNLAGLASYALFCTALALLLRRGLPGISPLLVGLVFFLSPWFRFTIFAPTSHSISLAWTLLCLLLLVRAGQRGHLALLAVAGLACGLNLYNFVGARALTLLLLLGTALAALLGLEGFRLPRSRRLLCVGLLTVAVLIPLGPNLLDPVHLATRMFHDQETVMGHMYWSEKAARSVPMTALKNIVAFPMLFTMRFQNQVQDLLLLLLAMGGFLVALRRRDLVGYLLALLAAGYFLAVSVFTNDWTPTRLGTASLPFLALACLGLDALRRWFVETWGPRVAKALAATVGAVFVMGTLFSYEDHWEQADIQEVVRTVARERPDLKAVIEVGEPERCRRWANLLLLALVEQGRETEARELRLVANTRREDLEKELGRFSPGQVLLLVIPRSPNPALPDLPLRLWRRFPGGHAVYTRAPKRSGGPDPEPRWASSAPAETLYHAQNH